MNKEFRTTKLITCLLLSIVSSQIFGQSKEKENDQVKMQHAQLGITNDKNVTYSHTTNPGAQWFPEAGFGLFIHWSICSIKEIDASWPMMKGTQIGWRAANNRLDSAEVKKIMDSKNYTKGAPCEEANNCITPVQYWDLAKEFNPKSYAPRKWVKAAKEAGMTYAVLTTRHHDGFALWPSAYGSFSTKNYMGGRDLVKDFVTACREYGLKVGLYYSGPDWCENGEYQNFMYQPLSKMYPNIPELDANLQVRTTVKTEVEKQAHYSKMAAYVKGQVKELLTNYGKIDMIWFDGGPNIPNGNEAWKECITMDQIHQLQPGIVVSPRFFGYGDYATFEQERALPTVKQNGWAELCITSTGWDWGYTNKPLKSSAFLMDYLIKSRAMNTNLLLNYGPTKDGVLTNQVYDQLKDFAQWMKINGSSIKGTKALDVSESASVSATASKDHRYLFVVQKNEKAPLTDEKVEFKTKRDIKKVSLLGSKDKVKYTIKDDVLTVYVSAAQRTTMPNVIDVELK